MLKFKNKKKILIIFLIVPAVLFLSGCSSKPVAPAYKVKLDVWGLFDSQSDFGNAFDAYKAMNPVIADIGYRKMVPETYKADIIEALALGQGPDVILIQNNWVPSLKEILAPAPAEIFGQQKMKNNFVDVVASDFMDEGQVYAVPLSVDTLALYYNKDLFNEAGIIFPPADWEEFVADVRKLTRTDLSGQITQSGTALGTAQNINRPTDILVTLMLQNGTEMTSQDKKQVTFNASRSSSSASKGSPGKNALDFYMQFSRRASPYYSWNNNMHYSIDAFGEGKLAMMLNYHYQKEAVEAKAPKLNFDIAPMPQLPDMPPAVYANYWGFAVLKNKGSSSGNVSNNTRINETWKFLSFLTAKPEISPDAAAVSGTNKNVSLMGYDAAKVYIEKNRVPAARRDLIESQKEDPELGVFALQNLIAKSWFQKDPDAIEGTFIDMIDQITRGQFRTDEALNFAVKKINQMAN